MRGPAGPTVVKLGGSYAFSTHLKDWIDAIAACPGRVVVAPGGGPLADAVRMAQQKMGFDDRAAHQMALRVRSRRLRVVDQHWTRAVLQMDLAAARRPGCSGAGSRR